MSISRRHLSLPLLIGVSAALLAIAMVATMATVWALRDDTIDDALIDAGNIATVLAEESARSVQSIEVTIAEIQDEIARQTAGDAQLINSFLRSRNAHDMLVERRSRLSQIETIALVDANGRLAASARSWPAAEADVNDREYFQYFRDAPNNDLFISRLIANRVSGELSIFFVRRITGLHGEFRGVVLIGVKYVYFQHIYNSVTSMRDQAFSLLNRDGTIMIRHPERHARVNGKRVPDNSPWYDLVRNGGGEFRSPGYFSGERRLVAVRPLKEFPLVVNVSFSEHAALERWRQRAITIGLIGVIVFPCAGILLWLLSRHGNRLIASRASLAEREARLADKTQELATTNSILDSALRDMSQGLTMFDSNGRLVMFNDRYRSMYGFEPGQVKPGMTLQDLLRMRRAIGTFNDAVDDPDAYVTNLRRQLARGEEVYVVSHLKDGRVIALHNRRAAHGEGWVCTHEDITAREHAKAQMTHMARHDALTDLANRSWFREKLDESLHRMRRGDGSISVLVIDLDMFKSVNDSLGHPIGDKVLRIVAERLRSIVKTGDTVGRLGGDEFAIVQSREPAQRQAAAQLAQRVIDELCAPYQIDEHEVLIGASIGIVQAPADGDNVSQLLKHADLALYRAKSSGRRAFRFFEAEMDSELRLRRELEIDLRQALTRDELELHYQPVINAATRLPDGAEALVRWRHPTRGMISPDRFIGIAEETGLIGPLGEWILHTACKRATTWPEHIRLAVNLSPVQFRNNDLLRVVNGALLASGLPAARLELEITESVLLQQSAGAIDMLHAIKKLGVGIVLDDFGTGYSSLSYLRMFPFDKIKIDRSFINEMPVRDDCAAIVAAITGLARSLDIETTAEGVETAEQFALLRAAGCTHAQGYLLGRPCPPNELDFATARGSIAA